MTDALPTLDRDTALAEGASAFANRIKKNLARLKSWREWEGVSCFRVYDRDIPEYAVAVDVYEDWVHVQEYRAPKTIPEATAQRRLAQVMAVLPDTLKVPAERIVLKVRARQKGKTQYEKLATQQHFHEVHEGGARLLVNFTDYLDTGLFLDHRPIREWIQAHSRGKRFLNLFAYTGAASVHAALGGAIRSYTVDMSATYLDWAQRNFALNDIALDGKHEFEQADCTAWLKRGGPTYDLIFMDPPTFSNSKRMRGVFDVQRDHVFLIRAAMRRLAPGGTLIFSNNYRGFKLDAGALAEFAVEDITADTIPPDFARRPDIHCCFRIRHA